MTDGAGFISPNLAREIPCIASGDVRKREEYKQRDGEAAGATQMVTGASREAHAYTHSLAFACA